jgi:hypothetical protein
MFMFVQIFQEIVKNKQYPEYRTRRRSCQLTSEQTNCVQLAGTIWGEELFPRCRISALPHRTNVNIHRVVGKWARVKPGETRALSLPGGVVDGANRGASAGSF